MTAPEQQPPPFVHLRVHSEFSLVDGLVKVKGLVSRVVDQGMGAVALTDQSNLFALVKFYGRAMDAGVKPIAGADVWIDGGEGEVPHRLTLLVRDLEGYRNLTELVSQSYTEGQRQHRALVDLEWLAPRTGGLIALSGPEEGAIARAVEAGQPEEAERALAWLTQSFPGSAYLELVRTGRPGEDQWIEEAVRLAGAHEVPVVATNDVRFLDADDFEAHETRVCIHDGRVLNDTRRPRRYSEQQYLRSPAEMVELFSDIPEAIENTVEIARRCTLKMELGTYYLPQYPVPDDMDLEQFLEAESRRGLETRLSRLLDAEASDYGERRKVYEDRLAFELEVINSMGFPGYFLIVAEFISWARENGVPVGPGRGSGAGSLVAYALGITDLDPLEYDLLFERFLNPQRVSMPDFDVDFCMEGRDRVISHVADLYGQDAVSQIVTYGTMAAKAVVRDVARVQGKPYGLADRLSKLIPFEVGMTLEKAMAQEEALRTFVAESEEVGEIMDMAYKLEGIVRNIGKHAGGVVIAPGKLTDFVPLVADESGSVMTQFDKDDVELAGLVKFDFLGLKTLTIIDWAMESVNAEREARGEARFAIEDIALDDPEVFRLLQDAATTAVFQLESRGMKDLIKRLQPDSFEDIIALVALFRPGPLQSGMVDDFIDRKHGRAEVEYAHPDLAPILENTYGVILYQEQVQRIAQVLAGYTLGGADLLRRAMGKKKPEEMAEQRAIFMEGASQREIEAATATYIFDLMEKFAGYGFNKSHSAAYALVSYQTAWLKHHHPAPFMAAVMSADLQNTDKIVLFIEECRHMGIEIVPPDVNQGSYRFAPAEHRVIYGLGAIKGVGEGVIEAIVEERTRAGAYTDLFDLCRRVEAKKLNKRVLEALIRSGACDTLVPAAEDGAPHRAALLAGIDDALRLADQAARNDESGMSDIFGDLGGGEADDGVTLPEVRAQGQPQRLAGEKETLGLYLSGHPIDGYEKELRHFARAPIADLRPGNGTQVIAGLVVDHRVMRTRRGDSIAFVTLDDRTDRIEAMIGRELLDDVRERLQRDVILVLEGDVSVDERTEGLRVRAKGVHTLPQARARFGHALTIELERNRAADNAPDVLRRVLSAHRGGRSPVEIRLLQPEAEALICLSSAWQVQVSDELIQRLQEELGATRVAVRYDAARGRSDVVVPMRRDPRMASG